MKYMSLFADIRFVMIDKKLIKTRYEKRTKRKWENSVSSGQYSTYEEYIRKNRSIVYSSFDDIIPNKSKRFVLTRIILYPYLAYSIFQLSRGLCVLK